MVQLVDPIKLLAERAAKTATPHVAVATAASLVVDDLPFEVPMTPPPGAKVRQLTIGSSYRTAIPILFDPATRTSYPVLDNK